MTTQQSLPLRNFISDIVPLSYGLGLQFLSKEYFVNLSLRSINKIDDAQMRLLLTPVIDSLL